MKRLLLFVAPLVLCVLLFSDALVAFCGFYVARADAKLFNRASQVVLVRDGDRTVLTMANDFRGDPKEFAVVIPVPSVLKREQIHVGDKALIDHLDAYSAPRLVEYFDENPCARREIGQPVVLEEWTLCRWRPRVAERSRDDRRSGRHSRSHLRRRGVRHPDPVGHPEWRAGHVAEGSRAIGCRRRRRRARQLHPAEPEVFRRQSEPDGADTAGLHLLCGRCRSPTNRPSSCSRCAWAP